MSQLQFSETQYVYPFETNGILQAGSFYSLANFEIRRIIPMVYFNDVSPVLEKIRALVYSTDQYNTAIFTSDWYTFAGLTTIGPYGRWYIPIEFDSYNINKNITYYLGFEIGNYTRSTSSWIGIESDVIDSIYTSEIIINDSPLRYLVDGDVKPV